jgi:hypothetical protein
MTIAVCFGEEITGRKATAPTACPGFQSWREFIVNLGNYVMTVEEYR